MHPLRVLLIASLVLGTAVAVAFVELLERSGAPAGGAIAAGAAVSLVFLLPWSGVFAWAVRRAGDLELLTERARRVAGGAYDEQVGDRRYHGELDDLGRTIDELRLVIVRQHASFADQRALI